MTCRELIDFLHQYISGELEEEARRGFEAHLAICPDCVNYLDSYRTTVELAGAALGAPEDPVPPDVPEELVEAILAARKRDRRGR